MGIEFQVKNSKFCFTPLKDKCKAIRNLESPKTLKTNKSILWHGQFFVIIPYQTKTTFDTYLQSTKEVQKV